MVYLLGRKLSCLIILPKDEERTCYIKIEKKDLKTNFLVVGEREVMVIEFQK